MGRGTLTSNSFVYTLLSTKIGAKYGGRGLCQTGCMTVSINSTCNVSLKL